MRIGLFVGSVGGASGLEGQLEQLVAAEDDGFDSLWLAQILGSDVLTLIALAGARTRRIEFGTAVVPTFPRHPLALAQQALTAQAASGGRLTLGIGLSHKPTVEGRMGLKFERPARHMEEYLAVLRALVTEGVVDFTGEMFNVRAAVQVPGATPFPIVVAALGPRMLRIAGESAEGTVTWMVGPRTLETHVVPRITTAAAGAGRPSPRVCVGVPIAVTDDTDEGMREARRVFHRYGELSSYRRMLDLEGVDGPADVAVVGNEAEVERQLRRLAEVGATEILAMIYPVGDDHAASVARTRSLLRSLVGRV